MLGRTHMMIGALGAAIAVPIWLHDPNAHAMLLHTGRNTLTSVKSIAAGIVAGALGGILPDLDQKDALMSRRVERIGQLMTLLAIVGLLVALHLWMSPVALIIALVALLAVVGHTEWMRKASLIFLAVGALGWGTTHQSWLEISLIITIWLVVTTFSSHRTFTHSLVGTAIAGIAMIQLGSHLHLPWLADTALLGYVLHLVADAIAGGIPILWPYKKRQGIHLVRTGGILDRFLGGLCTLAILAVLLV